MKKIHLNRAFVAKKKILLFCACAALLAGCSCKPAENQTQPTKDKPVVYMTRDISPESLVRIYEALGRKAEGKVAVKISTGEAGGHNYLKPALIEQLVKKVNGTIVECNTAYPGKRNTFEAHLQTPHFLEYKQGTLHMVKSLQLVATEPLAPEAMPLIFKKL